MKISSRFILFLLIIISLNSFVGCAGKKEIGQALNIIRKKDNNVKENVFVEKMEENIVIENAKENESIFKLIFVGDTMMDSRVASVMHEKGDDYPLSEFMPILKDGDLVLVNLETAVGTSRELIQKSYAFQTHPERFSLFEPIKDKVVFSLANNHGMDAPLKETLKHMKELEYYFVGIGNNMDEAFMPYIKTINGISIAFIGASRVIPIPEWSATKNRPGMATAYAHEPLIAAVEKYRDQVDYVVTYIHWGEERADEPNKAQLSLEKALIDAGADIIVGSHPHVLQEISWNSEKQLTAYSLGNFVFTTANNTLSNDTLALEIHISKEKIEHVKLWPGRINLGIVEFLGEKTDKDKIYNRLRNISKNIRIDEHGIVIKKE